jgi:heme/copper-type cytochrome/quinol oxidase subunit 1
MPWYRSPVKLFGYTGLLLFLVRVLFPPADFAGALQASTHLYFFDFRLDLTGFGLFEFAASVFLLCALTYYLVERITGRPPNDILVQLHFWPSLLFALFSVFIAHWVNSIPSSTAQDPAIQASLNHRLNAFMWASVVFLIFQIVFAVGAARIILRNRTAIVQP